MYGEDLNKYIQSNPDPRELKRAVTVKMWLDGYNHGQIQNILGVSSGFISKWTDKYEHSGIEALKLKYIGSKGYLKKEEQEEINQWLKEKDYWCLSEVKTEIIIRYNVEFESNQSYYDILNKAGISWKKSQKSNPKEDEELVKKKARNSRLVEIKP